MKEKKLMANTGLEIICKHAGTEQKENGKLVAKRIAKWE